MQPEGQALQQAQQNGLYRLLRSILRENLFHWQEQGSKLVLQVTKNALVGVTSDKTMQPIFWIEDPQYDDMGNLTSFRACFWQYDQQSTQVVDPAVALDCMLEITGNLTRPERSQNGQASKESYDPAWHRIREELANSVQNEALMLAWRQQKEQSIRQQVKDSKDLSGMLAWAQAEADSQLQKEASQGVGNSAIILEQWAAIGHPYHPGSKTKMGFSTDEVLAYAPEFYPSLPLVLIAVHQSLLKVSTLADALDYKAWFAEQYPQWFEQWLQCFKEGFKEHLECCKKMESEIDSAEFLPVPVHPWQLKHELATRFQSEIVAQKIWLQGPEFSVTPTLSVRTLAPGLNRFQPYIKLPVAAQMTSSKRNLSASSVDNAPILGKVLQQIMWQRPDIAKVLSCQWDEVGLHTCVDKDGRDDDRYLSVIFRQNPCLSLNQQAKEREHAVVVAALFTESTISGQPLLIELMRAADVCDRECALIWFRHYVDTLLLAVLDLYLDYGLALEAHQQNMMAIFTEQGRLKGFINRDVGGIGVYRQALQEAGWQPAFTPSATLVDTRAAARLNLSHTVMQSHIAEIIRVLNGRFSGTAESGLTLASMWQQVGEALEHRLALWYQRLLKTNSHDKAEQYVSAERKALFEDNWPGTAFIQMRLEGQSEHAVSQPLINPLSKYYREPPLVSANMKARNE